MGLAGLVGRSESILEMMPAMTVWKPGERLLVYFAAAGVGVETLRPAGFLAASVGLHRADGLIIGVSSVLCAVNYNLISTLPLVIGGLQLRTDVGT